MNSRLEVAGSSVNSRLDVAESSDALNQRVNAPLGRSAAEEGDAIPRERLAHAQMGSFTYKIERDGNRLQMRRCLMLPILTAREPLLDLYEEGLAVVVPAVVPGGRRLLHLLRRGEPVSLAKLRDRRVHVAAMREEQLGSLGDTHLDPLSHLGDPRLIDGGRVVELEKPSLEQLAGSGLDALPCVLERAGREQVVPRLDSVPDACRLEVQRRLAPHL